jgi:hypothetical protein
MVSQSSTSAPGGRKMPASHRPMPAFLISWIVVGILGRVGACGHPNEISFWEMQDGLILETFIPALASGARESGQSRHVCLHPLWGA